MVQVVATFLFQPEGVEEAIALARELVAETRKEKGCVQYDLARSGDRPEELVILESWETEEDLDVHSASPHFTRLVPALAALCTAPVTVKRYTQIV